MNLFYQTQVHGTTYEKRMFLVIMREMLQAASQTHSSKLLLGLGTTVFDKEYVPWWWIKFLWF